MDLIKILYLDFFRIFHVIYDERRLKKLNAELKSAHDFDPKKLF